MQEKHLEQVMKEHTFQPNLTKSGKVTKGQKRKFSGSSRNAKDEDSNGVKNRKRVASSDNDDLPLSPERRKISSDLKSDSVPEEPQKLDCIITALPRPILSCYDSPSSKQR
jgi:hypothetical protein